MSRFRAAIFFLAVAGVSAHAGQTVEAGGAPSGIAVLSPIAGLPWTGDRMRGARERLKDILPGNRG